MNIAIVGYGEQGRSSYEYWATNTDDINHITVCDQNTDIELPEGVKPKLGVNYLDDLHTFDLIVRAPSVHPKTILEANSEHPYIVDKITSNTEEFFRICKAPIIGVTGTKGKGTTSTLIARILEEAGKKVHIGGNIGTPPLDLIKEDVISSADYVVLELANFQLIDMRHSPHIAVCLMIAEEHLNWHADMYEYVRAKEQIFLHQKPEDIAVYNAKDVYATEIVTASPAHAKISYDAPDTDEPLEFTDGAYVDGSHIKMRGKTVLSVHDVTLKGRHNLQNVCAAVAATWDLIGQKPHVIKKAISGFKGLPHRLEEIGVYNNVTFVDDSFGSNPATADVAIKAYTQPKVLILGGSDKNNHFDDLIQTIASNNIRHIVAIGEMGPKIISMLKETPQGKNIPYTIIEINQTMKDIVSAAIQHAQPGDVVLLSTACASFDMFSDYKDRGQQFKAEVKAQNP